MKFSTQISTTKVLIITSILLIIIPPVVFFLVAVTSGLSISDTLAALVSRYQNKRMNLLLASAASFFPVLLLLFFLGVRRLLKKSAQKSALYAAIGVLPAILVALFVNLEYWPTFLPNQTYAGFPHGLEFVIGPGVFAPIGLAIAVFIVWLMTREQT